MTRESDLPVSPSDDSDLGINHCTIFSILKAKGFSEGHVTLFHQTYSGSFLVMSISLERLLESFEYRASTLVKPGILTAIRLADNLLRNCVPTVLLNYLSFKHYNI
jgi:hypothetical protein